jgi:hypothetical protein
VRARAGDWVVGYKKLGISSYNGKEFQKSSAQLDDLLYVREICSTKRSNARNGAFEVGVLEWRERSKMVAVATK